MKTKYQRRLSHGLMASVAIAGLSPAALPSVAHAQAFLSVVDVCTGVSLPRSAVTDIIGEVNTPIVSSVEGTVNGILTLIDPLIILPLPDPLNIDLTTILANAAAGAPIGVQVLDNNGTIVGPSDDCNLTADGVTLDTEAGISIGGNAITGLGANGQAATAGEIDAIAFGNNASTSVGSTGAIAIGTGASATAANSIALGAGSIADRGAQIGYAAPGLTGTFDSAGSVSVGAPGALRQITNVAPGTAPSDAATVGQVTGALAALSADTVQYDDATHAAVTFDGAGGTVLGNVAPGALNGTSMEAVNGSQLFATNQQVAANTTGLATLADNAVQYDDATNAVVTLDGAAGTTITNVAAGALNGTSTDAVNGSQLFATNQQVAANTAGLATLADNAVQYDDATNAVVTLDGAAGTTITNVAPGAVNALSTDAINGSQLFATNQQVAANVAVTATNTADIAALEATAVRYDDATQTSITLGGIGGTTISNVAAGELSASSSEAVNGSQLFATNQQVATNTANIATNTANITTLQGDVAGLQAGLGALNDRAVQYDDASNARITLEGAAGTTIGNVAAGDLSAASTEAVNGSQLFATNQTVAGNTTAIAGLDTRVTTNETNIANLDGRVTTNTADIANLDGRVTINEGDIAALDARTTVNEGDIANLDGRVTTNTTDIANLDARTTVNEGDIANLDGRVTVNEGDIATLDARTTVNEGDIAALETNVTAIDGRVTTNTTNITTL